MIGNGASITTVCAENPFNVIADIDHWSTPYGITRTSRSDWGMA
jgi:hypothetical protein